MQLSKRRPLAVLEGMPQLSQIRHKATEKLEDVVCLEAYFGHACVACKFLVTSSGRLQCCLCDERHDTDACLWCVQIPGQFKGHPPTICTWCHGIPWHMCIMIAVYQSFRGPISPCHQMPLTHVHGVCRFLVTSRGRLTGGWPKMTRPFWRAIGSKEASLGTISQSLLPLTPFCQMLSLTSVSRWCSIVMIVQCWCSSDYAELHARMVLWQ